MKMQQYDVTGMTCAACSARVEKAVSKVPGVTSCSVNLLTNSMGVEGTASSSDIIAAVTNAGSERYQGVHIRSAPHQRPEAAYKESLVYHHDRRSQQELYQPHCSVISLKEGRQRESPHHVPH